MLRNLLDLFLPLDCAGCHTDGVGWCAACADRFVARTGRPAVADVGSNGLPPVVVMGCYGGIIRTALLAYKERGRRDLAPVLGERLALAVAATVRDVPVGCRPFVVVGVPASAAAVRSRGIDHVAELLRAAPGVPVPCRLLRWRRRARDQASLDARSRAANVAGAITVRGGIAGRPLRPGVVLVDDVVTTGATLGEAARACRSAGFAVVGAAAVAATRLRPGEIVAAADVRTAGLPPGG